MQTSTTPHERPAPGLGRSRPRIVALLATLALTLTVLAFVVPPSGQVPAGATAQSGQLGTNLGAVTYYDGLVVFANLMDQASEWIPQRTGGAWGSGDPLTLRADGWPASLAASQYATAVLAEVRYPAGTYAVSWSGKGTFDINGRSFGSPTVSGGTGTVTLDGSSIALLNLRTTNVSDPVRSIDVRVPGESPTAVFRSTYLARLTPYTAVRFMDWQRTNSTFADATRTFTCANRTLPTSFSQGTPAGVSVERMVDLANTIDADPWFTVPHEASPDWVTCHAKVVAARLEVGLTPRYEFSNETWNPQFRAFHEVQAEGVADGLGSGDAFLALQQQHGLRHVETMAAVQAVFATAGRPFTRVMAGQAANAWVLEQRLGATGATTATDEVAIAPYLHVHGYNLFDAADAAEVATWSQATLFANLATSQTTEVDAWTGDHLALATRFGKRLVTYEAGQHLAGDTANATLTSLLTAANRSSAMGTAYATYLNRWKTMTGGALLMHFTDVGPFTQFGSWGALESPEQTTSPKYAALVAYADGAPPDVGDLGFVPVTPSRLVDSRASSSVGGFVTPWGPGTVRQIQVTGRGGVPADAAGVVVNIAAVKPSSSGGLTIWPTGEPQPASPDVRTTAGMTLDDLVTVPVGNGGAVSIANTRGTVDVLVDVVGYLTTSTAGTVSGFTPLTPGRILDSRPTSRVGAFATPWGPGQTRTVPVAGRAGVPGDASAVVLTVTAVNPTNASVVAVWPAGAQRPAAASALHVPAGRPTSNQIVTTLGSAGSVAVANRSGTTDVTVDVVGYYRAGTGARYVPIAPVRVLDSRPGTAVGAWTTPWGPATERVVQVTGNPGIPAGAVAVTGTWLTRTPTQASRLLVGGSGLTTPVSLSFPANHTTSQSVTARLADNGSVSVRNAVGRTDVIAEIDGYYR